MILDTNQALFLVEVVGVLAMPGPTNSLLFVSGATRGLRAGLHLPVAEVTAYLITVSLLLFVIGPAVEGQSVVSQLLRVLCGIYLAYMAVFLWRSGQPAPDARHPITALRIFLTTLVNPKNLLFAFVIFPPLNAGSDAMLFSFLNFSVICIAAGSGWVLAGALIRSAAASKIHLHHFYRGEAFLLAGFAIMILLSAYYAA
jgi:threonine/homoserine/homoserine lactone efflux protein